MKARILSLATLILLSTSACADRATAQAVPPVTPLLAATSSEEAPPMSSADAPLVQVAILLDTSNSMDGLINQARASLWRIVTELSRAKRQGLTPRLEVALYEYGNDRLAASEGHIRQVVPLTTDLDRISEELFALTTNGGSEHCGQAVQRAVSGLSWSSRTDALKLVFVAGNEPFDQGPVNWREAMRSAIGQGVVVNTVHCGSDSEGVRGHWREAAQLADGQYTIIDANREVAQVAAPQDAELQALNRELNDTYVAFEQRGKGKKDRMLEQDQAASSIGSATANERVAAKASANYDASDWDIVSAEAAGAVALDGIAEEELPAELKRLSKDERKGFVAEKARKRKELQAKIAKLSDERRGFVAAQKPASPAGAPASFDDAVVDTLKSQGEKKGLTW